MATQTRTVLSVARRTNFSQTSAPVDVPANLLAFNIRMVSAEFTDPSLTCAVSVFESVDQGVTWRFLAGFPPTSGGFDHFGDPRVPGIRVDLTQEQRDAALMKATILTSGAWSYGVALDLET